MIRKIPRISGGSENTQEPIQPPQQKVQLDHTSEELQRKTAAQLAQLLGDLEGHMVQQKKTRKAELMRRILAIADPRP